MACQGEYCGTADDAHALRMPRLVALCSLRSAGGWDPQALWNLENNLAFALPCFYPQTPMRQSLLTGLVAPALALSAVATLLGLCPFFLGAFSLFIKDSILSGLHGDCSLGWNEVLLLK